MCVATIDTGDTGCPARCGAARCEARRSGGSVGWLLSAWCGPNPYKPLWARLKDPGI